MRQLAAIMFADMVGFTALMQENEQLARAKRIRLKAVLEKEIASHNGNILQYYGDGSLSIFKSAADGVNAAVTIQQQLLQDPKVDLRIGIHTGDITMEDDAIYGDGVNLASRIESLAVPGGVFISEKVYDDIKNQQNIKTRELGYFELKNIREPVRIFAIAANGLITPTREQVQGKTKTPMNRVAVLPFVNMSADPDNEYFSDGITEELLNALTKVDGLQVTSRTSVFAFKGQHDDIREIGMKLNVDKILEGSVRKAGNRVRITAQLINTADGYHIWSENYDRNLTDIFEVQDEISSIIANKLRENLSMAKTIATEKKPVRNVTAYTLYLKGLHFWNKITPADARKAIECYQQAIELEPEYGEAFAMMAAAYSFLGSTGQMEPSKAFEYVRLYADKALAIDDTIAEGHTAKGSVHLFFEWNWDAACRSFERAMELNPAGMDAYELMSFYLILKGKIKEALELIEKAAAIDPLSPIINHHLGDCYIFNGQYDNAIRQADKVLEINPQMRASLEMKGWAYASKNDWESALNIFQEVHRQTNHPLKGLLGLGFAYARTGQREKAQECIQKLEQRAATEPDSVVDADIAAIAYALGDMDKAFYHMNKCVDRRMAPIVFFMEFPPMKDIKKDPRYFQLRARFGL